MPLADSSTAQTRRVIAIVGMAMVWPSVHNQILYPLTFAFNKEGMPSLFLHYLLYAIALLAVVLVFLTFQEKVSQRLFSSQKAITLCGLAGTLGLILLIACNFSSVFQSTLFAAGIAFYALFVPTHFVFWNYQLMRVSEKRGSFDLALSYLLFCGITLLRLGLGLHAWPFAIAYPLIASILAWVALATPEKQTYSLKQSSLRDFPWVQLGIATFFVYVASISVWLLNDSDALFNYPPSSRVLMYIIAAAAVACLCVLFRPHSHLRSKADFISLVFATTLLVVGILVSGVGERLGFELGNFPLLAGYIVLEMVIWIRLLVHAQVKHLGIIRPAAFYLIFVIGAANMLCTMLLYGNQLLLLSSENVPTLLVTIASAFIILLAVTIVMTAMLFRQTEAARISDVPCEAAIDSLIAEENALQQVQDTFGLSAREVDTLRLALKNKSAKAIAEELFVAESTVNSHLKSIYRKTDVHSRADLIALVERFQ